MGSKAIFGGLRALADAILKGHKPRSEIADIGRQFREIPNEEYFRSATSGAPDIPSARRQYGVDINAEPSLRALTVHSLEGSPDFAHTARVFGPEDVPGVDWGSKLHPEDLRMIDAFGPDATFYKINADATVPGQGNASQTYPAIYDILSGRNGMVNLSHELSALNELRKPFTTADAIKRNPVLAGKIAPNYQTTSAAGFTPLEYLDMSPDEQTGAWLLSGARNGVRNLDAYDEFIRKYGFDEDVDAFRNAARHLEELSPSSPPEYFNAYKHRFGKIMGENTGIGEGALRKLNLVDAILRGQADQIPERVRRGMGFNHGGLASLGVR